MTCKKKNKFIRYLVEKTKKNSCYSSQFDMTATRKREFRILKKGKMCVKMISLSKIALSHPEPSGTF